MPEVRFPQGILIQIIKKMLWGKINVTQAALSHEISVSIAHWYG